MERYEDVQIGKRLRKARTELGLTLEGVAKKVGFNNYQTLAQVESGVRSLRAAELNALSKIYSKDVWYFLSEDEPTEAKPVFAWRGHKEGSDTRVLAAEIESILQSYKLLEDLAGEARSLILAPWEFNSPDNDDASIEAMAQKLIDDLSLGYRPSVNLTQALEERLHVKILYLDLGQLGSAVSVLGDFGYGIIIDADEAPWRRNFDLAHEVFHLLSHKVYPIDRFHQTRTREDEDVERQADSFAAALLMPAKSVYGELQQRVEDGRLKVVDIVRMAIAFGVSAQAVCYRLANLRVAPWDKIRELVKSEDFISENKQQRIGMNQPALEFSERFVGLGVKVLNEGRISKGKFCEIFGIGRHKFLEFIQKYGFTEGTDHECVLEVNHS